MIDIGEIKADTVLVIAGPTASGKSGLALELAKDYNGMIINADSMQVYKGIPILSAAPTLEERQEAEHRLYEIFEPKQRGSVAEWSELAVEAVREAWQRKMLPIVVGGTGFYIETLIAGISPIPETNATVKALVEQIYNEGGVQKLYDVLAAKDAAGAAKVNPGDTTRVRRALEIFLDTGQSIEYWFRQPKRQLLPEARFKIVALLPCLSDLEGKCARRFDEMMQKGALAEAKALLALGLDRSLPAMKAIGVAELGAYLSGQVSLDEAVALAKLHTRQYAKRQLTWFRNRLAKLPVVEIIEKSKN